MPSLHLLQNLPAPGPEEHFEEILKRPGVRLERIVSDGQVSPPGFWYQQNYDEWVVVLQGAGHLEYDNGNIDILAPGDAVLIPAGRRHRVAYTEPRTVWLALHFDAPDSAPQLA
ncbi:cupin domain-containing protein [Uliginosibacterium gangwonense]|uniref:cupin domain-containing protein n=1 Tax=Uliginosibacterium gangwonense TaxID=392736 RepID=UPI000366298E|nr:cupin domain-containing protein [Uliginosibacterium gangwonense]